MSIALVIYYMYGVWYMIVYSERKHATMPPLECTQTFFGAMCFVCVWVCGAGTEVLVAIKWYLMLLARLVVRLIVP